MQSFYPEAFERDMACTEAEWLAWLPRAVGAHSCEVSGACARVSIGDGRLHLVWRVLPPRVLASVRLPRLGVRFEFSDMAEAGRQAFMQRFDLYTQRGGG